MPDCPRNWMRFRVRTPPPLSPATTRRAPANAPQRMAHRNGIFAVSARRHSTAGTPTAKRRNQGRARSSVHNRLHRYHDAVLIDERAETRGRSAWNAAMSAAV